MRCQTVLKLGNKKDHAVCRGVAPRCGLFMEREDMSQSVASFGKHGVSTTIWACMAAFSNPKLWALCAKKRT